MIADEKLSIRLCSRDPIERRKEWRKWKPLGYRILDKDGRTVYHELEGIRRMVVEFFKELDADVFLFGSQATGKAHIYSDYDIGYAAEDTVSNKALADLQEKLEELPIPGRVELVNFNEVPPKFAEIAIKGGVIVWKRKRKNSRFILQE